MPARQASDGSPQERADWVRSNLPDHLQERLKAILGGREGLEQILLAESRGAVRFNPLESSGRETERRLHALGVETAQVPWSESSRFIHDPAGRPLGHLFEHQAGHFFLHDAASTLPVAALDPQPGERILDLCAAPGGKTTHILARMDDQGLVVANDPRPHRVNHLVSTLDRMGALSCVVTQRDGRHSRWPYRFDRVLVDAPCTNLGGIHHSPGPAFKLHEGTPQRYVRIQRQLLLCAAQATRPGGTIVYSTCTLDPQENEENAAWFADQPGIVLEEHGLPLQGRPTPDVASPGAREAGEATLRIHPGDHDTDGFFIARFTRLDEASRRPTDQKSPANQPRQGQTLPKPAGRAPIDEIIEHNALDPTPLVDTHAITTPTRIWATRIESRLLHPLLPLVPTRIGQLIASREMLGPRLHFDAATRFGHSPQESIRLAPEQARAWLAGHTVKAPAGTSNHRHRVILCDDQPIGASRAYGETLPCFVPKHRRVPDEASMHGWLRASP